MNKEEFLNLVYNAYNSAIKLSEDSKKKISYFSEISNEDEVKKAESNLKFANYNVEKLKSLLLFPLYQILNNKSLDDFEKYGNDVIEKEKLKLEGLKEELATLTSKEEQLLVLQKQLVDDYIYENDSNKKEENIIKGSEIQASLTEVKVHILNKQKEIEELENFIKELSRKKPSDFKEELLMELGLTNLKTIKENSYYSEREKTIFSLSKDEDKYNDLLCALDKLRSIKDEDHSYLLELTSEDVNFVLQGGNLIKEGILCDSKITIDSFADIYAIKESVKITLEREKNYLGKIKQFTNNFESYDTVLKKLLVCQDLDVENFKLKLTEIVSVCPELSVVISSNVLENFNNYNGFFARTFKKKEFEELKSSLIDKIYTKIIRVIDETLMRISSMLSEINYNEKMKTNNIQDLNAMFLRDFVKNLSQENCGFIVEEILYHLPNIEKRFKVLVSELDNLKNESDTLNNSLNKELIDRDNRYNETLRQVERIYGSKLDSSEEKLLLDKFTNGSAEDSLSEIVRKQIISQVSAESFKQNISIDELRDFGDNNDLSHLTVSKKI